MRPLTHKLWRDAWHYRGQLSAIALVVLAGMALFVSLRSMHGWLRGSRDHYYLDTRFGDVFASVVRAPRRVADDVARVRGVRAVEARVVHDVVLDVPGLDEPASGRLVSIPVPRAPMLNALTLTRGRWPASNRADEVLVSQAFARANALAPGDSIGAIINGTWRRLVITGTAISPEYIYEIGTASIFPDSRRFGVVWMGTDALAAAWEMRGAFNDLVVTLEQGTRAEAVLPAIDTLLTRAGGRGAYPRREQLSDQFLSGEIDETQVTSIMLPAIFLGVTAFLLHIVLSRLVGTQREQVATLKAYGYSNGAIAAHYMAFAGIPIGIGGLLGAAVGAWFAGGLAEVYARFFQFPTAAYTQDPVIVATGLAVTVTAGLAGALSAVRRTVALPPAEAMRPEAPERYRPGVLEAAGLHPPPHLQVIVRHLERRPWKAVLTTVGLAVAGGMVTITFGLFDTIDYMKVLQFFDADRGDITVAYAGPERTDALEELRRVPGVLAAEPFRAIPARLTGVRSRRTYRTSILAVAPTIELRRIVDLEARQHHTPPVGVLLGTSLADTLGVRAGDAIHVDILEGDRRSVTVPVAGVVDDLMGMSAYVDLARAPSLTGTDDTHSGAWLRVDPRRSADVFATLKRMPAVAGASARTATLEGFERTIEESFRISLATTLGFACIIAFGIVYNSGRVTLSERGRELASLRVLGFTGREVGTMLVGEQAVLILASLPVASGVAWLLGWLIAMRFESTLFRLPVVIAPTSHLLGSAVVLGAAATSAVLLLRRLRRLDLVAVLKTRE